MVGTEQGDRASSAEPDAYWAQSPRPEQILSMREKYLALERLAAIAQEDARRHAIRFIVRRWPGALREAELVHPRVVAERMRWSENLPIDGSRDAWRRRDAHAVVLWADLHDLLSDQLDARRRHRNAERSAEAATASPEAATAGADPARNRSLDVQRFIGGLPSHAQARWPTASRLEDLCGDVVRPRQAYLWLAAKSGMALPDLNRVLFDRAGHWDRRDHDPAWAHDDDS